MKRVLIVDDEADVLWMLKRNLNREMLNVEVLTAASGKEALHVLQSHPVDLVITVINRPGMNGLDLLAYINNKYPHSGSIVITAYPSNTYQNQAILSGGLKFIEKPFDMKYLRKIVEEFFDHEKNSFRGTISGIDLIDIVQFNGLSRATAALKVKTEESTGMIFFKDGQVVHAVCDQMSGEEAFFAILGFHSGNLKNIKGVETPQVTISKSLELLLLQAARSDDEIMEVEEEPFLSYDDLAQEPPPAFLSQSEGMDESRSLLEEGPPAFLSDDVWTPVTVDELTTDTLPEVVMDTTVQAVTISGLDVDDDEPRERAYFAKTSSIISAELRDQRVAALSGKMPMTSSWDEGDKGVGEPPPDASPALLADAEKDSHPAMTMPAAPAWRSDRRRSERRQTPTADEDDFLGGLMREISSLGVSHEEGEEPPLADSLSDDVSDFPSDAAPAYLSTEPPAEPWVEEAAVAPLVAAVPQETTKEVITQGIVKADGAEPTLVLSPLDSVLAEFTAIDGVRLACLAGRDGFLIASQPEGGGAQAEALSAIASSGLGPAESMGEELFRDGLWGGLFEYQDGIIILSPLGRESFLMLVAEKGANLGWLRLIVRKNIGRIEEANVH